MGTFHATHGHWVWDDNERGLYFISHEVVSKPKSSIKSSLGMVKFAGCTHADLNITFHDTVDMLEKIRFRRHFQRRVKINEADVVTIRDVKDVVIFQTMSSLPPEFLDLFHTQGVDRMLRALIIYFQMYIQTFDILLQRRTEAENKLHQPRVLEVENKFRTDLCMLRSMVGREYCNILLGAGDLHRFHHMANKQHTSSGERDTRLFELLYRLSVRVVWIALRRHYGNLIEEELNRLFRTIMFNLMSRQGHHTAALASPHEDSILHGITEDKAKLLIHSPACLELTKEKDYRTLGIGYINFETKDPRIKFFELLFDCPEEEIVQNGITVGILGLPRVDFDAMLVEISKPASNGSEITVTSAPSYLCSRTIVTPEKSQFCIPELGEEEPVPVNFPRNNIPSPDVHFEERKDARLMWKMYNTHPTL